jgi:hypothetical protein
MNNVPPTFLYYCLTNAITTHMYVFKSIKFLLFITHEPLVVFGSSVKNEKKC